VAQNPHTLKPSTPQINIVCICCFSIFTRMYKICTFDGFWTSIVLTSKSVLENNPSYKKTKRLSATETKCDKREEAYHSKIIGQNTPNQAIRQNNLVYFQGGGYIECRLETSDLRMDSRKLAKCSFLEDFFEFTLRILKIKLKLSKI